MSFIAETLEEQMDYDEETGADDDQEEFAELMNDPKALEEMVASLPGVDPKSKEVQASLAKLKVICK